MKGTLLIASLAASLVAATTSAQPQKRLGNEDIEHMVRAGFKESTVLRAIQANDVSFDVSAVALINLKKAGVSPAVIEAMLDAQIRKGKPLQPGTSSVSPRSGPPPEVPPPDIRPELSTTPLKILTASPATEANTSSSPNRPGAGGVTYPSCVYCPSPVYSDNSRRGEIEGTVLLHVLITPEGKTGDIKVAKSINYELDQQAIQAVKVWQFRPAHGPNGNPVSVVVPIEINFRLIKRGP